MALASDLASRPQIDLDREFPRRYDANGEMDDRHSKRYGEGFVATSEPAGDDKDPEPPRCAACGGTISEEDLVCPHCGVSLAGG